MNIPSLSVCLVLGYIIICLAILIWGIFTYFGANKIYKNIDTELKKSEDELKNLKAYQNN